MAYDRINWENTPSHVTPLSAENLNTMDEAIDNIDEELNRVGVKAVNLEARMDTAETNITNIDEELTEQDTYAKGMGAKTLVHETDIATLKNQVTQIISGAPASPSEITDIRVAEHGTTYDTAGNAVRAQVRQMIEVQDTQPTDPGNKLWINDGSYDSENHQVPTWEEFSELKNDLTAVEDTVSSLDITVNGETIINYTEDKALNSSGQLVDSIGTCVSDKIPYTWTDSTRYYCGGDEYSMYVSFYAADDTHLKSFLIPNTGAEYRAINAETQVDGTVAYVRFSFRKGYAGKVVKHVNPAPAPYWIATETEVAGLTSKVETLEETKLTVYGLEYKTSAAELATGTTLTVATNIDNRKHDVIEFRGDISNFTSVTVGHGYQVNHGMWVTVDVTNITTYGDEDGAQVAQQPHGLTFSHFISVMIARGDNSRALIEITTDGGMYRWENVAWSGNRGSVFAFCTGTLINAKLASVFRDFNTPIFMFGDSYQSFGDSARYPYYLVQNGFTDFLAAGFPGANATHGIEAFRAIIAHATPKYVVWTLGMNGSDSSDAINTYWKDATDEVIATCEAKNITLILATVPNVPERVQVYKNSYVKASGERYIDFAKAVGAESQGSTWYTGMLSSDNVHPTALGAQALYAQLLADFPEIIR